VDSSWNKRAFQGFSLFVVDAVAVSSTNEELASDYADEISESARGEMLESKAMAMEAKVTQQALETGKADLVCVDGSIVARIGKARDPAAFSHAKKYAGAVFVAKSSESRAQFGSLGSAAGDIYYYNRASRSSAGFSAPFLLQTHFGPVTEVYARLRDSVPMVRIEIAGNASEGDVKGLLDRLCFHSVAGYPYCLKLAHNACKVSDEDIERVASIFSMRNEHGARDALNE
jgi:hypothetical protein